MKIQTIRMLLASTALVFSSHVSAQETPTFRVPIENSTGPSSTSSLWTWEESVSLCSNTCGSGTRATTYQCQDASVYDFGGTGYGAPEADAQCVANVGPKPTSTSANCVNYSSCNYDWVKPAVVQTPIPLDANPVGRVGCGLVNQKYSPYCQRGTGSEIIQLPASDHQLCKNDLPDYNPVASGDPDALGYDRDVVQVGVCATPDHEWRAPTWNSSDPWSSDCSSTATQTRIVTCYRKFDNSIQSDASCDAGTKPASSRTSARYGSCSYSAVNWTPWVSDSTCSSSTTERRSATCRRSDGSDVASSECTSRGVAVTEARARSDYSSCTYSWNPSSNTGWTSWSSTCSTNATRTRSVSCLRSDGSTVPDSSCSGAKPATSETSSQLGGCGYAWEASAFSTYSSTCSSSATRTRSVVCRRSDNTIVADSSCSGAKPPTSETSAQYGDCGYTYIVGPWQPWNQTCSASATRYRTITCMRSDNTAVADANCPGARPQQSETGPNYANCGYKWFAYGWSQYSSACSSTSTRARTVVCQRSDGTNVADSNCASAGPKPTSSETTAIYSGCTYSYDVGEWQAWNQACSASATRYRTITCTRSDGTAVADANCPGARPQQSETGPNYAGCGYSYVVGAWQAWNQACSASATRYRTVTCTRSDGAVVADANCPGARPQQSETGPNYSGCSYDWFAYGWSQYSSACSSTSSRTRTVICRREDGTNAADSSCNPSARPPSSETTAIYSGCSYTPNYGSYSACSNGSQSRTMTSCTRSDGANVSTSNCTAAGHQATQTQTCSNPIGTGATLYTIQRDSRDGGCSPAYWPYGNYNQSNASTDWLPAGPDCRAAGGTVERYTNGRCVYQTANYRQDYDSFWTETCKTL